MAWRALALTVAALTLAGCVMSLQEIRQTTPVRTAVVAGDYAQLANCAAEGLQTAPRGAWMLEPGNLLYQVIQRSEQRRATVTGYLEGAAYQAPMIDLTFVQRDGDVVIESRWGGLQNADNRGPQRIDERTWPIIERCAGTKVTPTAPTARQ